MDCYFHNIPGRLRVKNPLLKRNQHLVGEVERLLRSTDGVKSIVANLVTGSIVIQYDPHEVRSEDLLIALSQAGFFDLSRAVTNDVVIHRAFKRAGKAIGSILFGALVKEELEAPALSLIAALI